MITVGLGFFEGEVALVEMDDTRLEFGSKRFTSLRALFEDGDMGKFKSICSCLANFALSLSPFSLSLMMVYVYYVFVSTLAVSNSFLDR